MTHAEIQFDDSTEAFFDTASDEAPDSQRPVTLDLELQEPLSEEIGPDPARVAYLSARRERLKRAVAEIVATLAGLSGITFGMNFARTTAARTQHAAAASAVVQPAVTACAVPGEPSGVERAAPSRVAEPTAPAPSAAEAETGSDERKLRENSPISAATNPRAASLAKTRLLSALRQRFSRAPALDNHTQLASGARDRKDAGRRSSPSGAATTWPE
jgi:hypothetical protein